MSFFHILPGTDHWLGLNNIYKLTNRQYVKTQLKIILESFSGEVAIVTYDDFSLKDQVNNLINLLNGRNISMIQTKDFFKTFCFAYTLDLLALPL